MRTRRPDVPEPLIDLVARLFATGGDGPNGLEFVRRFQQLSTATAAKAVEDTAAYRDVRYIALNEVGCDPRRFSVTPAEFHDTIARWQRRASAAACTAPARTTRSAARTSGPA